MTERTYRIGEAARLLDLEGYVLRFWETEFPQLQPSRTPKGQRIYSEADLLLLRRIRELLHEQGMTIEGARRVLAGEARAPLDGLSSGGLSSCMSEAAQSPAGSDTGLPGLACLWQKGGVSTAAGSPVQAFLPLFSPRPAADQACHELLAQVERELLSLQHLLRQQG